VDRIQVTCQPQQATATTIALARLERYAAITRAFGPRHRVRPSCRAEDQLFEYLGCHPGTGMLRVLPAKAAR
jgi:hypothetical protein